MRRVAEFLARALGALVAVAMLMPILLLVRDAVAALADAPLQLWTVIGALVAGRGGDGIPLPLRQAVNGAAVAAGVAALCASLAPGAGYALALRQLPLRRIWLSLFALAVAAPITLTLVPGEIVLSAISLRDSLLSAGVLELGVAMAVAVWIMKAAFETVPSELIDAARFEGASPYVAYRQVALPLVRRAQAATFAVAFAMSWGEYLVGATLLSRSESQTLAAAIVTSARPAPGAWAHLAPQLAFAALPSAILLGLVQPRLDRWSGLDRLLARRAGR